MECVAEFVEAVLVVALLESSCVVRGESVAGEQRVEVGVRLVSGNFV